MYNIQLDKRSKDDAAVPGGEVWSHEINLRIMDIHKQWDVATDGTCKAYFQEIQTGGMWMTVDQEWNNMQVGGLTDADFAVPSDCSRHCITAEKEQMMFNTVSPDMAALFVN